MLAHCEPTLKSAEVFNSLNSSQRPYPAGGAAATAPPIRVLFLIDHLGGLGGGETSLVRLVRRMPPDRVRCFLVTFNPSVSPVLRAQLDCPFYVFPLRRAFGLQAMRVARQIRCLMCAEKIDLVHTFFESANLWGGLVCKLGGGPILVTSRRDMNILRKRGKHRLAYALVNRLCDRVLSVSEAVRELCIREEHLAPEKVVTLYNGIELERIASIPLDWQLRERFGFAAGDPIVTTVANVRRVKGLDTFVKAAHRVVSEFPHARFLVVGGENEPDYAAELHEEIRLKNLAKNVFLLGLTENVVPILKASQVFCLLSRSEGFSSALLEAMACSLPCVATLAGGNGEAVVDGTTGFLVAPDDPQAAADRVLRLLRDSALRATMGDAGYRRVASQFTVSTMLNNLIAFYQQLVEERGRQGSHAMFPKNS
jgi:glycosyltransferase involved in cell wall biosynthesis